MVFVGLQCCVVVLFVTCALGWFVFVCFTLYYGLFSLNLECFSYVLSGCRECLFGCGMFWVAIVSLMYT